MGEEAEVGVGSGWVSVSTILREGLEGGRSDVTWPENNPLELGELGSVSQPLDRTA